MKRLLPLILALTGCAATPEQLRYAYHGANAVDGATTLVGLDRGCIEGNPLLGDDPSDGTVAAFVVLQSLIYEGLYRYVRENHPDELKAFGWAFLTIKSLGVGWNASQLAKGCD